MKLQIARGQGDARAAGRDRALGPHGVNIMDFCKNFNARTAKDEGLIIPVVVTIYADRGATPSSPRRRPRPVLLKKVANLAKGSAEPNRNKVGTVTAKQVEEIARQQDAGPELRTDLEAAGEDRARHGAVDGHRRHRVTSRAG